MKRLLDFLGGFDVRAIVAVAAAGLLVAGGFGLLWHRYSVARTELGAARADAQYLREQLAAEENAFSDYRREVKAQEVEARKVNVKREIVYVQTSGIKETIVREVPAATAGYPPLSGALRVLHDAAASGCAQTPDPAAGRDAAPVDLAAFARTVVENYCRAEMNRQQLIRLQQYVQQRAQEAQ
jgi:hypothetical protein